MTTIIHPGCPPKFCKTNVFELFWNDCNIQEKLETMFMQNLWRLSKVHYGLCKNGEFARETGSVLCRIASRDCSEDVIAYFIG